MEKKMREKNTWIQKKRVVLLLVLILLIAILAIAARLGMKSGGRPHKIIGDSENSTEEQTKTKSDSEMNTGYGYEMDIFSEKNNSNEKKFVYEKQNNKLLSEDIRYLGVGGHLFAIAAQKSLEYGFGGFMYGFAANKELLHHYVEAFNGEIIGMLHPYQFIIDEENARKIVEVYEYEWTDDEI